MALSRLPIELIDILIPYTQPEGFESFALTCKKLYTLCSPFIESHNTLRSQFNKFSCEHHFGRPAFLSAYELINRIAIEPQTARYILHADFGLDGRNKYGLLGRDESDYDTEAVARLVAGSPYLQAANLDWRDYLNKMEEDREETRYSQHASAFVLTLLPNLRTLNLPKLWKQIEATEKLVETVVGKARQLPSPPGESSLAQVVKVEASVWIHREDNGSNFHSFTSLLALPREQYFRGRCAHMTTSVGVKPFPIADNLLRVDLECSCINAIGIRNFLRHTTRLESLSYSHLSSPTDARQDWDLCDFIIAIGREIGNKLQNLSISIRELRGAIPPGQIMLGDFRQLKRLRIPVELVLCHLSAINIQDGAQDDRLEAFQTKGSVTTKKMNQDLHLNNIRPELVSRLSFLSNGSSDHSQALDTIFRDFANRGGNHLLAVQDIEIISPYSANSLYKECLASLQEDLKKEDVSLNLKYRPPGISHWTWET